MGDIYRDCGGYEKNRRMADIINGLTSGSGVGGTSIWDGRLWVDTDNLSRETPETQRTVLDILSNYDD